MWACPSSNLKLDKTNYIRRYINTKVDIEQTLPFGFSSSVTRDGETNIYTHGKRNLEKDLPFTQDSIFRMASQSKFMGTAGFLKLIDNGKIDWNTPLKDYLPEYGSEYMKVIETVTTTGNYKLLFDPLYTTEGSNIIQIGHKNHQFKQGDYVSLEWSNGTVGVGETELPSVNGIPGFQLYNVFQIGSISQRGYTVNVPTPATLTGFCGGYVKIRSVQPGTLRSICFSPGEAYISPDITTYYYKEIPLERELTVLDVLTHGLGWSYYTYAMLYMSFGYRSNPTKRDIQAGIWNELGLPVGLPLSCYKCDIRDWVRAASKVPLLYQPGEDWSYGPQLSILGALISEIDGRCVEKYMKEELWEPLGMKDTGFFIRDRDPEYESKKDRVCQLYINMPKIILKVMGDDIVEKFYPMYEAQSCMYEGPRTLCLIDCGMYTTVQDYLKFMKLLLNNGKSDSGEQILSPDMIHQISTFQTNYDVSNLGSVSSYSNGLSKIFTGTKSDIARERLLTSMRWGLGVGTIQGCKNNPYSDRNNRGKDMLAISWGGVLGTRFLVDFCSGVAYNVGTNVIGPPAGVFDTDLIELNYKTMVCEDYGYIVTDLLL